MSNEQQPIRSVLRILGAARRLILELVALVVALTSLVAAVGALVGAWPY